MATLMIESGPIETRAALLRHDKVQGLWIGPQLGGGFYAGRVARVDEALGGAFLDLGDDKADAGQGFLNASDGGLPVEGETLLVQMKRPPIGGKGALLTRNFQLATPLMTWLPMTGKRKLAIDKKIIAPEERERLTQLMQEKGFKGELRIRPLMMGISAEIGRQAFTNLRMQYDAMVKAIKEDKTPRHLSQPRAAAAALTHFADHAPAQIEVSGLAGFLEVKALVEKQLGHRKVGLNAVQEVDLFERCGAEETLERALSPVVALAGGGRITIDEMEALTAIDIDVAATPGQSRKGSIIKACLEAIPVIFRQLMMRQIGGQVVIDFPALAAKGGGQLLSSLKAEAKKMPGARLGKMSDGGLFHLTLPKPEETLLERMTQKSGPGPVLGRVFTSKVLAAKAVRCLEKAMADAPATNFILEIAPDIATWLEHHNQWHSMITERFGSRFKVLAKEGQAREVFDVREKTCEKT